MPPRQRYPHGGSQNCALSREGVARARGVGKMTRACRGVLLSESLQRAQKSTNENCQKRTQAHNNKEKKYTRGVSLGKPQTNERVRYLGKTSRVGRRGKNHWFHWGAGRRGKGVKWGGERKKGGNKSLPERSVKSVRLIKRTAE